LLDFARNPPPGNVHQGAAKSGESRGGGMAFDGALFEARGINAWRGDRHILR